MRPGRLLAALLLSGGTLLAAAPTASATSPSGAWTNDQTGRVPTTGVVDPVATDGAGWVTAVFLNELVEP